jgi:hypothetical protein
MVRPSADWLGPAHVSAGAVCRAASIFSHSVALSADRWPDELRWSDIEPRFICKVCGKSGAYSGAVASR